MMFLVKQIRLRVLAAKKTQGAQVDDKKIAQEAEKLEQLKKRS